MSFKGSKMKAIQVSTAVLMTAVAIFAQSGEVDITDITKSTDCEHIYTTACVFDSNGRYIPDLALIQFLLCGELHAGRSSLYRAFKQLRRCVCGYCASYGFFRFDGRRRHGFFDGPFGVHR